MAFRAITLGSCFSSSVLHTLLIHVLAAGLCAQAPEVLNDVRKMLKNGESLVELRAARSDLDLGKTLYAADEVYFSATGERSLLYMVLMESTMYLKRKTKAIGNNGKDAETIAVLGEGFLWSSIDDPREGWRIYDFNRDGNPDILVVTARGASLGGVMRILSIEPEKPATDLLCKSVLGWKFRVLQGQQGPIVEVFDRYRSSVQRYQWNGKCIDQLTGK